jgi:hypothetical protein
VCVVAAGVRGVKEVGIGAVGNIGKGVGDGEEVSIGVEERESPNIESEDVLFPYVMNLFCCAVADSTKRLEAITIIMKKIGIMFFEVSPILGHPSFWCSSCSMRSIGSVSFR